MAFKYTEEQLNKLDKELLVQLFLGLQDQMEGLTKQTQALNDKMQLVMEQLVLSKKSRFGRSSEKWQGLARSVLWKWTGRLCFLTRQRQSVTWMPRSRTAWSRSSRKRKSGR